MKSMDFEEFLYAKGVNESVISYIKDCFVNKKQISDAVHKSMLRYFKEYICVGGMPSVVNVFVNTNDMNQVFMEQRDILEGYRDDFAKHLDEYENEKIDKSLLIKINRVFDSIPIQLAKENKKFVINNIEKKATLNKYEAAIGWLVDYGLISLCNNLQIPETPLEGMKIDNIFKIYVNDSGLLMAMLGEKIYSDVLLNDFGIYKGAIFENIVADAFIKNNKKLYYFSKSSGLKIDFITKIDSSITLIEVKAKSGNTKASKEVLNNKEKYKEVEKLVRIKDANIGVIDNIVTIPYYLTFLL